MKKFLLLTSFLTFFFIFSTVADNPSVFTKNKNEKPETNTQKSGSSIAGGLLILVSIGIGYGTRKIYELRSKNRDEIS
jgi:hypothetical protein